MNETPGITITNSVFASGTGNTVIDKRKEITKIYKLDEKQVEKLLDKWIKEFSQAIGGDVSNATDTITNIVNNKFIALVCKSDEMHQSVDEIKQIVQSNVRLLQHNNTVVEDMKAQFDGFDKNLEKLCNDYASDARRAYANISQQLDRIESKVDSIKTDYQREIGIAYGCLDNADFNSAREYFNRALSSSIDSQCAEAYFGLALTEWKIQLIFDPTLDCYCPILHDIQIDLDNNPAYQAASQYGSEKQKQVYEDFVKKISNILQIFRKLEAMKLVYDCFICVKVSDENKNKTDDCQWLKENQVYDKLKKVGTNPFFSEETLQELILSFSSQGFRENVAYEAVISYALSRAKCMLLVCGDEKYLNTPWVKNEYTRFCSFLRNNELDTRQIVVVTNGNSLTIPGVTRDNQDIDRSKNKDSVNAIISEVQGRIQFAKHYVSPNAKYCLKCDDWYPSSSRLCPQCDSKLVDAYTYLNESRIKQQDTIDHLRNELSKTKSLQQQVENLRKELAQSQSDLEQERLMPKTADARSAVGAKRSVARISNYDHDLFDIDETTGVLVEFKSDSYNKDVSIPFGVTAIGEHAFCGCTKIPSVVIPNSVTKIEAFAFERCSGLKRVTIGNRAKSIGDFAFSRCDGLTDIVIPDSVTSIGAYAFAACRGLTSVTIGRSVTDVGEWAFGNFELVGECRRLVEVYNKSSLSISCQSKDNGCVARYARNVYTADGASKLTVQNGFVVYDGNTLVDYVGTDMEITIPENITVVNEYALAHRVFTSVTIPESVIAIGAEAMFCCGSLSQIKYAGTAERWKSVTKGNLWCFNVPAAEVECADKKVAL